MQGEDDQEKKPPKGIRIQAEATSTHEYEDPQGGDDADKKVANVNTPVSSNRLGAQVVDGGHVHNNKPIFQSGSAIQLLPNTGSNSAMDS